MKKEKIGQLNLSLKSCDKISTQHGVSDASDGHRGVALIPLLVSQLSTPSARVSAIGHLLTEVMSFLWYP